MALPTLRTAGPAAGIALAIGAVAWWTRTRSAEAEAQTQARLAPRRRRVEPSAVDIKVA